MGCSYMLCRHTCVSPCLSRRCVELTWLEARELEACVGLVGVCSALDAEVQLLCS
jgi:hypothetical protein